MRLVLTGLICVAAASVFARASAEATVTLRASVGTSCLLTAGGLDVKHLPRGTYRVLVRDASPRKTFWLRGPGVNRTTGYSLTGEVVWRIRLVRGWYRYGCTRGRGRKFQIA